MMRPDINLTTAIIGLNVIMYLLTMSNQNLVYRMLFINKAVRYKREYDRLFISGFAHGSPLHLLFNMLTLYYFGPHVEEAYGPTAFLGIFLLSIIGGNLFCMLTHREDPDYSALGASGGLFGVVYAFIWMFPEVRLSLMFLPVGIPGWLFGILITLVSAILTQLPRAEEARISHEGHLGGALTGSLIAMFLFLPGFTQDTNLWFLAGAVLPVAIFGLIKWLFPGILYKHRNRF